MKKIKKVIFLKERVKRKCRKRVTFVTECESVSISSSSQHGDSSENKIESPLSDVFGLEKKMKKPFLMLFPFQSVVVMRVVPKMSGGSPFNFVLIFVYFLLF